MPSENGNKNRWLGWIPWGISGIAIMISLYFNAVGYGETKNMAQDTSSRFKEYCAKNDLKLVSTDTALNDLKLQLAVSQKQNEMILESINALRQDMKEARVR
jgi:hypothetical protein